MPFCSMHFCSHARLTVAMTCHLTALAVLPVRGALTVFGAVTVLGALASRCLSCRPLIVSPRISGFLLPGAVGRVPRIHVIHVGRVLRIPDTRQALSLALQVLSLPLDRFLLLHLTHELISR